MAEIPKSEPEFDYEYFYDEIETPTIEYPEIFNEEGKKSQALPMVKDNKKYVLRKILRKRRKLSEKISSVGYGKL